AEYPYAERLSYIMKIALGRHREQLALQVANRISEEHGVGNDDVIMHVEVEASAEALRKTDCSASQRPMCVSERDKAPPRADEALPAKDLFDEEAPAGAQSCLVLGENEAQVVGHREHPLPQAHWREDRIDQA